MGDDLISREAVLDIFHRIEIIIGRATGKTFAFSKIIDEIKEIPAADVRPVVRAHWIETAPINEETMKPFIVKGPHLKCSNCGSIEFQRKFCPNCGADMREEQHD